jgi:hypothetical protein
VSVSEAMWKPRLSELSDQLTRNGDLRSAPWRTAFAETPRHVFVPIVISITESGSTTLSGTNPAQQQSWLNQVYSNDLTRHTMYGSSFVDDSEESATTRIHEFQHDAKPDGADAGSPRRPR